jgi:hypothetical protein
VFGGFYRVCGVDVFAGFESFVAFAGLFSFAVGFGEAQLTSWQGSTPLGFNSRNRW